MHEKESCYIPGSPRYEDDLKDVIEEIQEGICDEVSRERVGYVIGLKRATNSPDGNRPLRVVLAAHADEAGMMVKHIGGAQLGQWIRGRVAGQ